jgi:hypothetical protein
MRTATAASKLGGEYLLWAGCRGVIILDRRTLRLVAGRPFKTGLAFRV